MFVVTFKIRAFSLSVGDIYRSPGGGDGTWRKAVRVGRSRHGVTVSYEYLVTDHRCRGGRRWYRQGILPLERHGFRKILAIADPEEG